MKKIKKMIMFVCFFVGILCLDVQLIHEVQKQAEFSKSISKEVLYESFRNEQIPIEISMELQSEKLESKDFSKRLLSYLILKDPDQDKCNELFAQLNKRNPDVMNEFLPYMEAVWGDLVYFPVPVSTINDKATVSYGDSWMQTRTYGGNRGHEGCDIMAGINERGIYPVVSITSGTVEKIGWLSAGGYRIGIRSPMGGYFYYAHLSDYAKEFQEGEEIKAGELLGFMGDTGYSDVEGTVGNFDVHLHVGIYINDMEGKEVSVNPYWVLRYLENNRLNYEY